MKMYEITALEKEIDLEEDEEIRETLKEMVKIELEQKSSGIAKVILNQDSELSAIDVEIKRLQDIKKSKSRKMDKFKEYVIYNMQEMGIDKIQTSVGTLSIGKSVRTEVDESKLPESAFIIEMVKKRKPIKELEEMGIVDGIEKVNNYTLKIK